MKCGPDGCPIVAFSDLTPAEQRMERQRTAKKMAEQGFTEQQIAKQLGWSQATISGDLGNLSTVDKLKPAKTASNPKGAGRPKGKKSTATPGRGRNGKTQITPADEATIVHAHFEEGKSLQEAAQSVGMKSDMVARFVVAREQGRREAEPTITPEMLSMSAQQKLDAAIRQYKKRLMAQFNKAVSDKVRQHYDEIVLPGIKKQIDQAKQLYARRTGLMDKATFNAIRRGLHPDSRNSISDGVLAVAFDKFMSLEKYLLDEKDSPTSWPPLPSSLAEWDREKAKVKAERAARRAAGQRGQMTRGG
jgi:predicted ArsR family transcriptional regulator